MLTDPIILAETGTFTEVKGETSDPDRTDSILLETQTKTKTNNETTDDDAGVDSFSGSWSRGNAKPMLFSAAMPATAKEVTFKYDPDLAMCVAADGSPLIAGSAMEGVETYTETATRSETTDNDR
jgi:putative ATP-grasp target RiPP